MGIVTGYLSQLVNNGIKLYNGAASVSANNPLPIVFSTATIGKPPITTMYKQFAREDVECVNPIAYAYTLLEQSGEFTEATWNV